MDKNKGIKAVIVAAGKGSRFGGDLPKQYCLLCNRPLLMMTIERFIDAVGFGNIVLVINRSMEEYWLELCRKYDFRSPSIVYGGSTRIESVSNAIAYLCEKDIDDDATVMVHDGARPLASASFIRRMQIADGYCGAIPVVPLTDSLRLLSQDGGSEPVDRALYRCVQTPQVFTLGRLREAYAQVGDKSLTDDASVMENAGFTNIALLPGEPTNIKITNPSDIAIAEAIMSAMR